jgi:DeoR/GlpR family transcriptional regulator of sugar metabolism
MQFVARLGGPVLTVERQRRIVAAMHRHGSRRVADLAEALGASVATIRRDLAHLEAAGAVRRVHGGAVLTEPPGPSASADALELPRPIRTAANASLKERIGRAAAQFINDGDTLLITGGTTTAALLPALASRRDVSVVTNALNVAVSLSEYPDVDVFVLGGHLRRTELTLLGDSTAEELAAYRIDLAVYGCFGIDPVDGLTSTSQIEVSTDRRLLPQANRLMVLADHTKFSQHGPIRFAPVEAVDILVTDQEAPADAVAQLIGRGVHVVQA